MRGVAVFLIFYFVFHNIRSRRVAHFAAFLLIVSCMVNVLWTPVQRLIGRGVEMHGLAPDGPVAKAFLWEGDTLLEANGKKVRTPEDVLAEVQQNEITKVKFYRPDFDFIVDVKRADLLAGDDAMTQLGFSSWKKSHNWRSTGFYGHYTTYAEVLQLIASLVLGLFIAIFAARGRRRGEREMGREGERERGRKGHCVIRSPRLPFSPSPSLRVSPSPRLPLSPSPPLPFSRSPRRTLHLPRADVPRAAAHGDTRIAARVHDFRRGNRVGRTRT